jgi:hypothetical protein
VQKVSWYRAGRYMKYTDASSSLNALIHEHHNLLNVNRSKQYRASCCRLPAAIACMFERRVQEVVPEERAVGVSFPPGKFLAVQSLLSLIDTLLHCCPAAMVVLATAAAQSCLQCTSVPTGCACTCRLPLATLLSSYSVSLKPDHLVPQGITELGYTSDAVHIILHKL